MPHARAGSWKEAGTCAQRSRTVDRDRQLKAAVRVGGGGSGRLSELALLFAVRVRPPTVHRASGGTGWWFARSCAKILAGDSVFGVILHLKLRAALGKRGPRCLFIVGSHSSAVTPAPLLPLCLAQRRYFFALDDANWMESAAPNKRTTTVVNQQNRVFSSLNATKTPERRRTRPPSASCFENSKENSDRPQPHPSPPPPFTTFPSWELGAGTCAQRSRTVD